MSLQILGSISFPKTRTVTEETGNHELGTVADGVDSRVLDDDTLVTGQEGLEGTNNPSEVRLCRCRERA